MYIGKYWFHAGYDYVLNCYPNMPLLFADPFFSSQQMAWLKATVMADALMMYYYIHL